MTLRLSAPVILKWLLTTSLLTFFLISSCAPPRLYQQLSDNYYPLFIDDSDSESLLQAIDQQLSYLEGLPLEKEFSFGDQSFTIAQLAESLDTFSDIVAAKPSPYELDEVVKQHFNVYQIGATTKDTYGPVLLTGYYEPLFEGSLVKDDTYQFPLYAVPASLVSHRDGPKGTTSVGRLTGDGSFKPFWTRQEIENQNVLHGDELVYLKDRFDAYLLHIQGSGRISFPDGTTRALHFAGSNGLGYKSLGRLFVTKKIMAVKDVSAFSMRHYFNDHPDRLTEMLHHNPRYIFFKWGDEHGPRGSIGRVLTPGRSVAIDHSVYPTGALGYLLSRRPILNEDGTIRRWKTFSRFVLPQDSGSAIKGPKRVDLYWGAGQYAETAASHMKEPAQYYVLIKKPGGTGRIKVANSGIL